MCRSRTAGSIAAGLLPLHQTLVHHGGQSARGGDAELAGVGAGAGDHVLDLAGAAQGQVQLPELGVERRQVGLGDPAQHQVLLDRGANVIAHVLAGDGWPAGASARR